MANAGACSFPRDAVRVRVKKCIAGQPLDHRKFSVDPQITSYEILHSIIGKAFDMRGEFALSYRALDDYGHETLLPLLSDWDLDAAVVGASDPHLTIHIEAKPVTDKPWRDQVLQNDVFGTIEIPRSRNVESKSQGNLPGMLKNKMERTLNIFQRAFNLGDEVAATVVTPVRPPLTDVEFRKYLDPIGQITRMKELRSSIYYGGVEPSLRKVVWKHILNVYPEGMSGKERMDYMKKKTQEYETLKATWRQMLQQGHACDQLSFVTSMVRKDVLRTDRHHKFYAGSDDNQNIAALFNILTTYALNHPSVSYCQGMSDLASPLLVTMCDEAHAYICLCALMSRLRPNFMLDGEQMTLNFQHLTEALMQCDPQFYAYLKYHQAEDLLFCYRWLLLEMKREFAFDDALHMLEVLWSSIDVKPPESDLPLWEVQFSGSACSPPISPLVRTPRETPYSKVCAMRRQSSSQSLTSLTSARRQKMRENQSLDENVLNKQSRLRKQGRLKPFLSLDDNCMEMHEAAGRETDPLQMMKRNINSMKQSNKHNALSSSTGNLVETKRKSPISEKGGGSLNKLQLEKENEEGRRAHKKTVKNLNEFLTLAGRGRGWRSQCSSISESDADRAGNYFNRCGGQQLEVCSDAESDASSLKHTSSYSSSISPNVFDPPASDDDLSPDNPPHQMGQGRRTEDSSPDDSAEYCPVTTSMTTELRLELEHLDKQVLENTQSKTTTEPEIFIWENPIKVPTPDEQKELEIDVKTTQDCQPAVVEQTAELPNFLARSALTTSNIIHSIKSGLRSPAQAFTLLPPPEEFGGGNPFLMFLCLTLLRQHRDLIMSNQMDYNEMAMHFDKMVRKHNVERVLDEARQMFATYLKQQSLQPAHNPKHSFKV